MRDQFAGTALEGTTETRAFDLRWQANDRAREILAHTPALDVWMLAVTHHGGKGGKTEEQWKWWGIKANWDRS